MSGCRKICILCQTSPKRWFGNMSMTSNCDVTNSAHQIQMTTISHWMKSPHKNFLRTLLRGIVTFTRVELIQVDLVNVKKQKRQKGERKKLQLSQETFNLLFYSGSEVKRRHFCGTCKRSENRRTRDRLTVDLRNDENRPSLITGEGAEERQEVSLKSTIYCKRPAEQHLHWERNEKRIPGQSITSSIVKSLSEATFGLMGWGEVK